MRSARVALVVSAVAAAGLLLAGCTSSVTTGSGSGGPSDSPSASAPSSAPTSGYYVSIGDSYASGYQPGGTTRNGFAYQLVGAAAARGYRLTLVNFGCSGATSGGVIGTGGCSGANLGPGAAPYSQGQAAAAAAFIKAHRGQIALVTVSVGGNDVTGCGTNPSPFTCLTSALANVKKNVATLLTRLRAAAGPSVRIVGITYPDILLAGLLSPDATVRSVAPLSVTAFQSLINPALKQTYAAAGAGFVDVTTATDAYLPLTSTTMLAPYGTVPVALAKLCEYTYACEGDIHPKTPGYAVISRLIAATLPRR